MTITSNHASSSSLPWPTVFSNPYSLQIPPNSITHSSAIANKDNPKPPQPPDTTTTSFSILGSLDLVSVYVACLRSDRSDRLYTTIVCDEHGICLGFVNCTILH